MTHRNNIKHTPFLKWAGGKRWLVKHYPHIFPSFSGKYIEPFLGGGSVFFHITPDRAVLSDTNAELINTYLAIRNNWQEVFDLLQHHARKHSDAYYYSVRTSRPKSLAGKAARFIYLNRACFNGIYRVNRKGQFNVPRGTRNRIIFETDDFEELSRLLKNVELKACDFEEVIDSASDGDLVFADPPYTVCHNNNSFIKYNEKLFSWDDQVRLVSCLKRAAQRGAFVIATNAYHQSVIKLYRNYFQLKPIYRKSLISADKKFRGKYEELLIRGNVEHAESYNRVFR